MSREIVRMDWNNPYCWQVAPFIFWRMWNFTERYDTEGTPEETSGLARTWFTTGDKRLGLWAIVDSEAGLVGHLFANPEPIVTDPRQWRYVLVRQAEANDNIDIRHESKEVFKQVEEWTRSLGLNTLLILTHKSSEAMSRRWGFHEYKSLLKKELT